MTAAIAAVAVLALVVRTVSQRIASSTGSVDRWFWRLYVERSRSGDGFPPRLPQYLLDREQWYPPLFPWILVRTPPGALARVEPWLGVALDLVRLLVVLALGVALFPGEARAVAAAGTAFAVAPILVIYNVQPNPRALGALWLDCLLVALALGMRPEAPLWPWVAASILGALVLLTHKMTAQLTVFTLLGVAMATGDLRVLALLPGSVALALVLSGGFYRKVLVAHWDIVTFWNRNWRQLGADPVRESPVYGDPSYETPGKHHASGLDGVLRHVRRLVRLLPAAWVLVVPLAMAGGPPDEPVIAMVALLLLLQLSFALLTVYVPALKCLGSGHLYLYNAASPVALLWGWWASTAHDASTWLAYGAGVAASAVAVGHFWHGSRRSEERHAAGWQGLIDYLRTAPRGPVLCLPVGLYDELTCRTGQPVLFGGHGLGFRSLEPVFPVLRSTIPEMRERYGLRWVVAREDALTERLLRDLPAASERRFGTFRLYALEG